jgi:hypothetical protein
MNPTIAFDGEFITARFRENPSWARDKRWDPQTSNHVFAAGIGSPATTAI